MKCGQVVAMNMYLKYFHSHASDDDDIIHFVAVNAHLKCHINYSILNT